MNQDRELRGTDALDLPWLILKADAFVGIDVFGASAPGGTCVMDARSGT